MSREIIFDTETTGFDPADGHRLVEIGCVELIDLLPSGRKFQAYANPRRDMPIEAFRVHGLSAEFLATKPIFADIAQDFLAFIGDAPLIAHNADFDLAFVNWELRHAGLPPLAAARVIDTVAIARRMFPGTRVSLDNLCRRFNIDLSGRDKHGALLDAELLAEVYLELKGGRQNRLVLAAEPAKARAEGETAAKTRPHRRFELTPEEQARHQGFVDRLPASLWRR